MRIVSLCLALALLAVADKPLSFASSVHQDDNQTKEKIYQPEEVDRRPRITRKSEPRYTEQARKNHTNGYVVLRVVLKSSGDVGEITVIRGLEDGLTEECIRAARETKYEPAMKDGNPVSTYVKFEYSFWTT
jgi:TonB family protein